MTPITFFVRGEPKAQPRPRAFARNFGGKWQARVYDAKTSENWKSLIAVAAAGLFKKPIEGPVSLSLIFFMPRPKSHRRANGELKESAPVWHLSKPDADNLEKAVMDALTQIGAWRDDSQVCSKSTRKYYASVESVGCSISVETLFAVRPNTSSWRCSQSPD